jgi:hypothetical protein
VVALGRVDHLDDGLEAPRRLVEDWRAALPYRSSASRASAVSAAAGRKSFDPM